MLTRTAPPLLTTPPAFLAGEAERFTHYRSLADAMPLIVWISRDGVGVDYYSRCWFEYTGLEVAGPGDLGWHTALHPEDEPLLARLGAAGRDWAGSTRTPTPCRSGSATGAAASPSSVWPRRP